MLSEIRVEPMARIHLKITKIPGSFAIPLNTRFILKKLVIKDAEGLGDAAQFQKELWQLLAKYNIK